MIYRRTNTRSDRAVEGRRVAKILCQAATALAVMAFSSPVMASGGVKLSDLVSKDAVKVDSLVRRASVVEVPMSAIAQHDAMRQRSEKALQLALSRAHESLQGTDRIAIRVLTADGKPRVTEMAIAAQKKPAPVTPPAFPSAGDVALRISRDAQTGELTFSPESLRLQAGQTLALAIDEPSRVLVGKNVNLFVRDHAVLSWDRDRLMFSGVAQGSTEVYLVIDGKMNILNAEVTGAASVDSEQSIAKVSNPSQNSVPSLDLPRDFFDLAGLIDQGSMSTHARVREPQLLAAAEPSIAQMVGEVSDGDDDGSRARAPSVIKPVSLGGGAFRTKLPLQYGTIRIQFVDERSATDASQVYAVAGLRVRVIGTEFAAETDAAGFVTFRDMPASSRFLVAVDDPLGRVRPTLVEAQSEEDDVLVQKRVTLLRDLAFVNYGRAVNVVQDERLGSVCLSVRDASMDSASAPGVSVTFSGEMDGPVYFNRFGFADRAATTSGPDGRACFFNVPEGPASFGFYKDRELIGSAVVSAYAGRNVASTVWVNVETEVTTTLAAMPTAHEQLSSDSLAARAYRPIDDATLVPFGSEQAFDGVARGLASGVVTSSPQSGRVFAIAQMAEFEQVVYQYPALEERASHRGPGIKATPLVPRGFIEDMGLFAQTVQEQELGSVMIEHQQMEGQDPAPLSVRLVDQRGEDVATSWYYSDQPLTRAIFFNVQPGTYALIVETKEKFWLSADVVTVFQGHTSFVQTGGELQYKVDLAEVPLRSNSLQ